MNSGSGRLEDPHEKVILGSITPPDGTDWETLVEQLESHHFPGDDASTLLLGDGDTTGFLTIEPPTGSGPGGTILKDDWSGVTLTTPTVNGNGGTVQLMMKDLDNDDGSAELLRRNTLGQLEIFSSADGANFVLEKTLTGPSGTTSFDVMEADGKGGARGAIDIVLAGSSDITIFYGDDLPIAADQSAPSLSNWGTTSRTFTIPDTGYSIKKLVAGPLSGSGYDSIMYYAEDASGNTIRKVLYMTEAAATQRDLSGLTPTDVKLSDETGELLSTWSIYETGELLSIELVDLNLDGAPDILLAYEDGTVKTILSTITTRTDLSGLADGTTGIIEELASDLNPSVLQTQSGSQSTNGAWYDTKGSADSTHVTQWGYGEIKDCTTVICSGATGLETETPEVVVGSPVAPTDPSVSDHGPPCQLPGSNVVPVNTKFFIDFPIVRTRATINPHPSICLCTPLLTTRMPVYRFHVSIQVPTVCFPSL